LVGWREIERENGEERVGKGAWKALERVWSWGKRNVQNREGSESLSLGTFIHFRDHHPIV